MQAVELIRLYLEKSGLTQRSLGAVCGVEARRICDVLTGHRRLSTALEAALCVGMRIPAGSLRNPGPSVRAAIIEAAVRERAARSFEAEAQRLRTDVSQHDSAA